MKRWHLVAAFKHLTMIKQIKMYTVVCDNCGKDVSEGQEFAGYEDACYMQDIASESDWYYDGDKDYCPDCYGYDDNDQVLIKTKND